jgi:RNA polymerase sigma-70 factor (ECF subfamily)
MSSSGADLLTKQFFINKTLANSDMEGMAERFRVKRQQVPSQNQGEPEAVGSRLLEIFRRCSPDLHRYVRQRLRGSPDVADLTQEIFERFIRADWSTRARNPHAYLFGIASHVVADAQLMQQREAVVYDSEIAESAGAALSSEDADGSEDIALQDELLTALAHLPDVHRAAIVLTKRDGLSCKEAAAKMGTTEGSVRVYVCEARAQLKVLLKQRQGRRKER